MADRRPRPLDDDSVPVDLFPADQTNRLDPAPDPEPGGPESDSDLLLPGADELFPQSTTRHDLQPAPRFAFEAQLADETLELAAPEPPSAFIVPRAPASVEERAPSALRPATVTVPAPAAVPDPEPAIFIKPKPFPLARPIPALGFRAPATES